MNQNKRTTKPRVERKRAVVTIAPSHQKWAKIHVACAVTGFSRAMICRLIADPQNGIETFLHRSHPGAKSGSRLVNLVSLINYFDRKAAATKEVQEAAPC